MTNNIDAFEKLCGNCAGLDINEITNDDVREMGIINDASADEIEAAIKGLEEVKSQDN